MTHRYHVLKGAKDSKPFILSFLDALVDKQPLDIDVAQPWVLRIVIQYEDRQANGLPSPSEDALLTRMEDEFDNVLKAYGAALFLGRLSWDGVRELFYVVDAPQKINSALELLTRQDRPARSFGYDLSVDANLHRLKRRFGLG